MSMLVLVSDASHALGNLITNQRPTAVVKEFIYVDDTLLIALDSGVAETICAMHSKMRPKTWFSIQLEECSNIAYPSRIANLET